MTDRLIPALRVLLATVWAGSLWTVGYLAAPTLFATLADRALAGSIAGSLFRVEAWVSVACGLSLLVLLMGNHRFERRRSCLVLVVLMLVCVSVGYFGLQPFMAELRALAAASGGVMDEATRSRFGVLHGVASVIYLVQSVLAVGLVLRVR
jgi:ABC-type amino acid transport system permease subunit